MTGYAKPAALWYCAVLLVIAASFGARASSRLETYRAELGLWQDRERFRSNDLLLHINLARLLRDIGEPDDALAHARKAIDLNRADARCYQMMGSVLFQMGRLQDSVATFRKPFVGTPIMHKRNAILGRRCLTWADLTRPKPI
jgi:tetratricopeptide (TPR) repeat protein